MHEASKDRIPAPETLEDTMPHINVHWAFCTDHQCKIHFDAKVNNGFFPQRTDRKNRDKQRDGRTIRTREQTPGEELVPHARSDWKMCYQDTCPDHLAAKRQAGRFPKGMKRSQKGRLSRPKN